MAASDYAVRTMCRAELDLAVNWAAAEGWNPGKHDANAFHAADPSGFLVGVHDRRPIGSISAVRYPGGFGFIGLYIVIPERRGQGYGMALWRAAMDHLGGGDGGTIGLDGVVAQQANYRKSGFVLAYRNISYGGIPPARPAPERLIEGLVEARHVPFDRLLALDGRLFPAPRPGFLANWITLPESTALAVVGSDGDVRGFGVLRACRAGHKIGPLYGDEPAVAEALALGLSARTDGGRVFIDVPEVNPAAVRLAERLGMTPVSETARMYAGKAPDIDLDRVFGVTSFELG